MSTASGASVATSRVTAFTVSRIPDDNVNHSVWSIQVEATGFGKWAVRWAGRCLNHDLTWEYEPLPSSRDDKFLARCRWDGSEPAIHAALTAEPKIKVNGLTAADVLGRHSADSGTSGGAA